MDISQIISPLKRKLWSTVAPLAVAFGASAATVPIYINGSPVDSPPQIAPQIDARAWVNQARFNVTRFNFSPIPFESLNTRFFTNNSTMFGDPGFRFFRNTNGQRFWMDSWVNRGDLVTDHTGFLSAFGGGIVFFFNDSTASILQVAATNIFNTAPLSSGSHGLIRLEGRSIDVSRSTLRTGSDPFAPPLTSFTTVGASNYVNDVGIYDLYWGVGTNNTLDSSGGTLQLGAFNVASPPTQVSEVFESFQGFIFQTFAQVPSFFSPGGYTAAAYTSSLNATSRIVQVVFFPADTFDPDFTNEVRFVPRGFGSSGPIGPATVMVAFRSRDFDIVSETETSESVYLVDGAAVNTNLFFAQNVGGVTRRPSTYQVSRNVPFGFDTGTTGNVAYSSALLSGPNFQLTDVTNTYASYSVQVDLSSSSPSGSIPYDPTNMPGRIELIGDDVNVEETRIRADSSFTLRATNNLVGNHLPQVDAPFVNLDVRSVQPELVVSNIAPLTVRRLSGTISAWSGAWENFETDPTGATTNTITVRTHVLIVDSQMQAVRPVTVNEFSVRGTNVVVMDQLNIGKSFRIEGHSWHLTSGLTLPPGQSLGASNVVNIRHFTNDGVIRITGSENFGMDRALSYSNYVNHGTNIAAAHYIRSRYFENTGYLQADGGLFNLDALNVRLEGAPLIQETTVITFGTNQFTNTITLQSAPQIDGASDVQIFTRDLTASNSIITANRLIFSVTNRLVDGGTEGTNRWSVTNGFQVLRRPTTSDLLGTYLRSTLARQRQADHVWAATNLGANASGFTNNLALGKLTFDGGDRSLFRFAGPGTNNALYVDYIEMLNGATNFNSLFAIAPNMTIYFANANVPVSKLDGAANGRFRWVQSFTGPLSSTNITYPSGNTYTFNIALVSSRDLDSDGDDIVNADDPTPIYVAESAVLFVALAAAPEPCVELSWRALSYSSNYLEFKASASESDWRVLTNFHMGPYTWPVTIADPVTTNGASRVYRLRVDPGPY